MIRQLIYSGTILLGLLYIGSSSFGQVSVTGPTCVVPGIAYQYKVTGIWSSTSAMHVCLTGGVIADGQDTATCTKAGFPVSSVLVKWNKGSQGSVVLSSSSGNYTLNITVTTPLSPGKIDTPVKYQTLRKDTIPLTITCSSDSGGACSPAYAYQWQQSSDYVSWTDIPGDTSQSLVFSSAIFQTTYYRRKVTETTSGTIGFSDVANVFLVPPPGGSASDTTISKKADSVTTGFNNHFLRIGKYNLSIYPNGMAAETAAIGIRKEFFSRSKEFGLSKYIYITA